MRPSKVTLSNGFYLGKYEVTQAQYEAVMTGNTETDSNGNVISATPSQWPNNPDRPVEKVSWDDIQVFLTRLNAQEAGNIPAGWAYALPTEAQWEYACRAGTTTAYSWGIALPPAMPIIILRSVKLPMSVLTVPTLGAFLTCTAMSGNGRRMLMVPMHRVHKPIHSMRGLRVRPCLSGWFLWSDWDPSLRSAYRSPEYAPSTRYYNLGFRVGFQQMPDTTAPVITILNTIGTWPSYSDQGSEPTFPTFEYSAIDNVDGDISSQVTISTGFGSFTNEQDGTEEGSAYATFTVTDSSGNTSTHTAYGPAEIIGGIGDSDGDGVDDLSDAFPDDPTRW